MVIPERQKEARELSLQAEKTKEAMLNLMYDSSNGFFCDGLCSETSSPGTYHSQHYPLWLGVTPEKDLDVAYKYLANQGMRGSTYSSHSVLHGLYKRTASIDHGQLPLDLMVQCSNQSWCNMIQSGATTSWEMWNFYQGTHSHPWSSTPTSAIAFGLFGLRPTVPGWKEWRAKLACGNLTFGKIKMPTPRGPIIQNFSKSITEDFVFHLVEMPKDTIAQEICLPNFGKMIGKNSDEVFLYMNGKKIRARYENLRYKSYVCADNITESGRFTFTL